MNLAPLLRRTLPLTALTLFALPALSGCGIRPTAVPVDAGAPASRTACPTPVQVPNAATPGSATATPAPGATAVPTASRPPTAVSSAPAGPAVSSPAPVFSASPSPTASRCP